jgi:hypothetical protein
MWPQYANLTAQYNKVEDPRHKQANNTHANLYSELQRNKEAGGGDRLGVGRVVEVIVLPELEREEIGLARSGLARSGVN